MTFGLSRHRIKRPRLSYRECGYRDFCRMIRQAGKRNLLDELLAPLQVQDALGKARPEVSAALALYTRRPFWTATELAHMWPLICDGILRRTPWKVTPRELRAALLRWQLPLLRNTDGTFDFERDGALQEFFIVEDCRNLATLALSQEQFDSLSKKGNGQ